MECLMTSCGSLSKLPTTLKAFRTPGPALGSVGSSLYSRTIRSSFWKRCTKGRSTRWSESFLLSTSTLRWTKSLWSQKFMAFLQFRWTTSSQSMSWYKLTLFQRCMTTRWTTASIWKDRLWIGKSLRKCPWINWSTGHRPEAKCLKILTTKDWTTWSTSWTWTLKREKSYATLWALTSSFWTTWETWITLYWWELKEDSLPWRNDRLPMLTSYLWIGMTKTFKLGSIRRSIKTKRA